MNFFFKLVGLKLENLYINFSNYKHSTIYNTGRFSYEKYLINGLRFLEYL